MARDNQKHVNLYLPIDLYNRVVETELPMTTAIISGLEKLLDTQVDTNLLHEEYKPNSELVTSLQARIDTLEEQLKIKDSQINIIDSRMEDRIRSLEEQLRIKDSQLENKDSQLENKDSQLEKQAVHIQSLIQENSKLNTKLLPEVTKVKRPWWRFW